MNVMALAPRTDLLWPAMVPVACSHGLSGHSLRAQSEGTVCKLKAQLVQLHVAMITAQLTKAAE